MSLAGPQVNYLKTLDPRNAHCNVHNRIQDTVAAIKDCETMDVVAILHLLDVNERNNCSRSDQSFVGVPSPTVR